MPISACGIKCEECSFYKKECQGCFSMAGKPFWTAHATKDGICPLFNCAIHQNNFNHCGDCDELPCKMFREMKDPNCSDEEHQQSIVNRVKTLHDSKN